MIQDDVRAWIFLVDFKDFPKVILFKKLISCVFCFFSKALYYTCIKHFDYLSGTLASFKVITIPVFFLEICIEIKIALLNCKWHWQEQCAN